MEAEPHFKSDWESSPLRKKVKMDHSTLAGITRKKALDMKKVGVAF